MDMSYSRALQSQIAAGNAILRPGWVRLNFNYFISEAEFDYLLGAIELVAKHGWRLLPCYRFDVTSGVWRFHSEARSLPVSLEGLSFDQLEPTARAAAAPWELGKLLVEAERELTTTSPRQSVTCPTRQKDYAGLRCPSSGNDQLLGGTRALPSPTDRNSVTCVQ